MPRKKDERDAELSSALREVREAMLEVVNSQKIIMNKEMRGGGITTAHIIIGASIIALSFWAFMLFQGYTRNLTAEQINSVATEKRIEAAVKAEIQTPGACYGQNTIDALLERIEDKENMSSP